MFNFLENLIHIKSAKDTMFKFKRVLLAIDLDSNKWIFRLYKLLNVEQDGRMAPGITGGLVSWTFPTKYD